MADQAGSKRPEGKGQGKPKAGEAKSKEAGSQQKRRPAIVTGTELAAVNLAPVAAPVLSTLQRGDGGMAEQVQLVLYLSDGSPLSLGQQPRDLSGRDLYSLAASALGTAEDSFYLMSHGRKQHFSRSTMPLSARDVGQTVSFRTLGRYRGAGGKKLKHDEDSDKDQVRRNPMRKGRPRPGDFALVIPDGHILVYQTNVPALEELVVRANSSIECQLHCAGIRAAAALYLEEAPEPGKGMGIRLTRPVLEGQNLIPCYYSGGISDRDNGGNHCLHLGSWFDQTVFLDGAQCVPSREQHTTPMQIVNHKCHEYSNSEVHWKEFKDDAGGLGLLELHVKGPLAAGTFLSFDYVRRGGNFFRQGLAGTTTPRGFQRIRCDCGPGGVCPRDLQRFERAVHTRFLDSVSALIAPQSRLSEANRVSNASAQPASDSGRDFAHHGLGPRCIASDSQIMYSAACGRSENSPVVNEGKFVGRSALELTPEKERAVAAQCPGHAAANSLVCTISNGLVVETMLQAPPAILDYNSAVIREELTQASQARDSRYLVNTPQIVSPRFQVPTSVLEAEILLNKKFDFASHWGPSLTLTRTERLARGRRLRLFSSKWNWVSEVLTSYPELARLKRDQRFKDFQQQSASVQRRASDQVVVESTESEAITGATHLNPAILPSLDTDQAQESAKERSVSMKPRDSDMGTPSLDSPPWTSLELCILDVQLSIVGPGLNVNARPYASIRGTLHLGWRGKRRILKIDDEVRAVRGEGSCGPLGIQDVVREAESDPTFQMRRTMHKDLQGVFKERWEMLLAMASDRAAEGVRIAIYCHTLMNRSRLRHIFVQDPAMSTDQIQQMESFERLHGFVFGADMPCPVRKAAFLFLRPSSHLDEKYIELLLDWLEHKVALIPFTQVQREGDGCPIVFHVPEADMISDRAVLFIKLLNIEKHGPARMALNHFNRIGGRHPVGFLEDLAVEQTLTGVSMVSNTECPQHAELEGSSHRELELTEIALEKEKEKTSAASWENSRAVGQICGADQLGDIANTDEREHGAHDHDVNEIAGDSATDNRKGIAERNALATAPRYADESDSLSLQAIDAETTKLQIPRTIFEAETLLWKFDIATHWGPGGELTRAERLRRRRKYGPDPPGWGWVDEILRLYPVLAQLTKNQKISKYVQPVVTGRIESRKGPVRTGEETSNRIQAVRAGSDTARELKYQEDWIQGTAGRRRLGESNPTVTVERESPQQTKNTARGTVRRTEAESPTTKQRNKGTRRTRGPQSGWRQYTLAECWPLKGSNAVSVDEKRQQELGTGTDERVQVKDTMAAVGAHNSGMDWEITEDQVKEMDGPSLPSEKTPGGDRQVHTEMPIPTLERIPGITPWIPGTSGLYPRPTAYGSAILQKPTWALWNIRFPGMGRQRAMFAESDKKSREAFYVAADVWSAKKGKWHLGKIFGAFSSPEAFVIGMLVQSRTRCFYELIRDGRACKAYLDVEAEPGVMTQEQGRTMCSCVVEEWSRLVHDRWPQAMRECPKCLNALVLDGSRNTDKGWKTSFHIIYPWLSFANNTGTLKVMASKLSGRPNMLYRTLTGESKSFVDPAVYTRNRQFRMGMSWKLSDSTCTALRLPGHSTLSTFLLTCITRLEPDAWCVPEDPNLGGQVQRKTAKVYRLMASPEDDLMDGIDKVVKASLMRLLRAAGQPPGQIRMQDSEQGPVLRWETEGERPCRLASLWRDGRASHKSNGAFIKYDSTGAVFIKCLHPKCLPLNPGKGDFIGWSKELKTWMEHKEGRQHEQGMPHSTSPETSKGTKRQDEGTHQRNVRGRTGWSDGTRTATYQGLIKGTCTVVKGLQLRDKRSESKIGNDEEDRDVMMENEEILGDPLDRDQKAQTSLTKLDRAESFARLHQRNQIQDDGPFGGWCEMTGPYGGRLGELNVADGALERRLGNSLGQIKATGVEEALQEWLKQPMFQGPAPAPILSAVHATLEKNNWEQSKRCGGVLPKEEPNSQPQVAETSIRHTEQTAETHRVPNTISWEVLPSEAWFADPIGRRELVGHLLLERARNNIRTSLCGDMGQESGQQIAHKANLWDSPFIVGSLNVGFRRLQNSLPGVLELVESHRPDILFLLDLYTPRNKIGKLRGRLELGLAEEWFLVTDIRTGEGRPLGIGALLHASLARQVSKIELVCPPGLDVTKWKAAVEGRILIVEVSRPELSHSWWFGGVYQHVAEVANSEARDLILCTLNHMQHLARERQCKFSILGDLNVASEGGRWGYSSNSRVHQFDRKMMEWISASGFREVKSEPVQATWRACLHPKKAALDRALIYPFDTVVSPLVVQWAQKQPVFDHALILVRFPQSEVGIGFAGACRPFHSQHQLKRCRVNLRKWNEQREEWCRLLRQSLIAEEQASIVNPPDPFQALKAGELLADSIAYALAPRRSLAKGETRRSFAFSGHRVLFRELNLLQAARQLVHASLSQPVGASLCPVRMSQWSLLIPSLNSRLCKSKHVCPPPLVRSPVYYFQLTARSQLEQWMIKAKEAVAVRWAAIREDHAKAHFSNVQRLRDKLIKNGGVLDKHSIQAALGKKQPKQRMWGMAGTVMLGVSLGTPEWTWEEVLVQTTTLPAANHIQRVIGAAGELQFWFRGPRLLGDFLLQWCQDEDRRGKVKLQLLAPSGKYVAVVADDMLAVQELHMAGEGMDTESICLTCATKAVKPIVTSAVAQPNGNPMRAVRFFCTHCQRIHNTVDLGPLPPCPVPKAVWEAMRKLPKDIGPILTKPVDLDTMDRIRAKWRTGLSAGTDAIPREYVKYGPIEFLELYRAATNAFLRGDTPSVCAHEWEGTMLALIAKVMAALEVKEHRPVARLCTKCIAAYTVASMRFQQAMEEYKLITDAQEGFRKNRSTKRQLAKFKWMSEDQQRRRCVVVQLDMDLANAFNAPNHRPIILTIANYGFHPNDVAFLQRMLQKMWVSVGSEIGESAACDLRRGFWQGNTPSPDLFIAVLNPVHAMVEASGRGCYITTLQRPDGSSGYADDSKFRTDGPDAISAMQVIVDKVEAHGDWLGTAVNMKKSSITAVDLATGKEVDTSSITLHGQPFPVVKPDQATKSLGVRMSLTGDYNAEKKYVMEETERRVSALAPNQILTPCLKELALQMGICSIFRYSAGLVPWTTTELNKLHTLWLKAYKKSWGSDRGVDDSPFLLDRAEGGRGCPLPEEVWLEEVKNLYEQCLHLPGNISQLAIYQLQQVCQQHGCVTLDQTQRILRILGRAQTVEEWFLLRLDQRGVEMSSPWSVPAGTLVAETLWPYLRKVWTDKMEWLGCTELSEELAEDWKQVQLCMKAIKQLGQAGIFLISQLVDSNSRWKQWSDIRKKDWQLTANEYKSLLQSLDQLNAKEALHKTGDNTSSSTQEGDFVRCLNLVTWPHLARTGHDRCEQETMHDDHDQLTATYRRLPGYLVGTYRAKAAHDCVELGYWAPTAESDIEVHMISDDQLADELGQHRAVFTMHLDETQEISVECLTPLRRVRQPYAGPEMMIVQRFDADGDSNDMAVIPVALIRDCLLAEGVTYLHAACARPAWRVSQDELSTCFNLCRDKSHRQTNPDWLMLDRDNGGQLVLGGVSQGIWQRRGRVPDFKTISVQKWQMEKIPSNIQIDLMNHEPLQLPSPEQWEIWQRNARVVITNANRALVTMCSAQYGMLLELSGAPVPATKPTANVLGAIRDSCLAQSSADLEYQVHWSRHLLACLRRITGAQLLIGARAVKFHPHFSFFISPDANDIFLGAADSWPDVPAVLIINSYPPTARSQILQQASTHGSPVWVLRQDESTHAAREELMVLRQKNAKLVAILPRDSLVLHDQRCWSCANWDSKPARTASQVWRLGCGRTSEEPTSPQEFQQQLGCWETRRYDFYWNDNPPRPLQLYRSHQQDACQYTWNGLVGASDGSADMKKEKMSMGFVVGLDPIPLFDSAASVGGPLAALRAESVGLLSLIRRVRETLGPTEPIRLLVFIDCLVLLWILLKWGASEFCPDPRDVVHFDVIIQLVTEMRRWKGVILLKKIKGHTGCMLNELADERADKGYADDGQPLCPGPQKYGSLWLRIRPSLRAAAESEGITSSLPRNSAPDKLILRRVAALNTLRATALRSTIFVTTALHREDSKIVRKVIRLCTESAIRCWIKAMCATYPIYTYLHRINREISPWCPFCAEKVRETFTHFTCVCPKFREARTAAHNQLRDKVSRLLQKQLADIGGWTLYEEVRIAEVGLRLRSVDADAVALTGRQLHLKPDGTCDVGRLQPDLVAISWPRRRIAIIDISRPSDVYIGQLLSAHDRKKTSYQPLLHALQDYVTDGWKVAILPWVVGVRGLVKDQHLTDVLEFLEIPTTAWASILEASVRTSVEGFAFLNRVRFSTQQARKSWGTLDRHETDQCGKEDENQAGGKRKRLESGAEELTELVRRWKNMAATGRRRSGAMEGNRRAPPAPD